MAWTKTSSFPRVMFLVTLMLGAATWGCSGAGGATSSFAGGGPPAGGSASGGNTAIGGATVTGGTAAAGGSAGGNATTGGSAALGGSVATGGRTGTGETPSSGGSVASGGNVASGGKPGTGGTPASGGATGTGGKTATGGTSASGGAPGTGGNSGAGGVTASGGRTATGGSAGGTTGGPPPTGTMRIFYLRPSDVPFDQKYPDGIGKVMVETQAFFKTQLGKTFKLNDPIVEVLVGEHPRTWYETTANGSDNYWWAAANGQQEVARRIGLSIPDKRWMVVSEVSAEGNGAGGGATGGWVLLCGHDADGGAGYPAEKARWVGGMVHEVGHAFGLDDSTSTDGTCMSGSFYGWPNCTFTQSQKDQMLNGNWGVGKFLF